MPAPPSVAAATTTPAAGDDPVVGLDPSRVAPGSATAAALTSFVARLRAAGFDGTSASVSDAASDDQGVPVLAALARGEVVPRAAAHDALVADDLEALRAGGVLLLVGGDAGLSAKLLPMRSVYTLLPFGRPDEDVVYLGEDSVCLFEIVWAARGIGDRAVDLATGNGFIAASLATRFDHVVAADLSPRCVATAALVPVLNPHLRTRFDAVQLDVADGLRPGSFDLVTANAPWVPETAGPDGGPPRRFAAGGPTGFELPRRFVDAAATLLAPGGRAYVACLDIRFDDGRRPVAEHAPVVAERGYEVAITETRLNDRTDLGPWAARQAPGATSARHVVVELHRPA